MDGKLTQEEALRLLRARTLSVWEDAALLREYIRLCGITQSECAVRLGRSQSSVANRLRLLRLTDGERRAMQEAGLSERHARALLKLPDEGAKLSAIAEIVRQNMSVARAEKYIESLCAQSPQTQPKVNLGAFLNSLSQSLARIQSCGIGAVSERRETEDKIVLTITIPKTNRSLQSAENPLK